MMLPAFRQLAANIIHEWPSNSGFGNAFIYLWEQYLDNVKTNLTTHCERRLKKFFRMRMFELNDNANIFNYFNDIFGQADAMPYYDETDVRNAINYTYNRRDTTNGDGDRQQRLGELLDELRWMGAPDDCNIKEFVENNWFASIRMWTEIQRDIHMFNIAYNGHPKKPKIRNFAVVPICSFQRRHIRIDTRALYDILAKVNLLPKKCSAKKAKNGKVNQINITMEEFSRNRIGSWNLFFDVDQILKLSHIKRDFHCQIVSDGVSATILYDKPKVQPVELSDEQVCEKLESGEITIVAGMDPGDKTYNATVCLDLTTGEEVSLTD